MSLVARDATTQEQHEANRGEAQPLPGSALWMSRWSRAANALWIPAYVLALVWWHDRVPDGPNNDAVEEALRGLYLVRGHHLEVMTFAVGNSAETLYLYLTGVVATLIGPTTLALQLPGWVFAVAVVWMLAVAARRLEPDLPGIVVILIGVSSLWLFHFARSGVRTITAPFFLLGFFLALMRSETAASPGSSRRHAAIAGGMLALGLYSYTSCRVIPIVLAIYAALRLGSTPNRAERRALLSTYGSLLGVAAIVSIPNLVSFAGHPQEFLFRGSYSAPGSLAGKLQALMWTAVMPFHYPVDLTSGMTGLPRFEVDGITNGLVIAGLRPIHPVVAAAFVYGLVRAYGRRREPAVLFLIVALLTSIASLGLAGPALGRLLIVLPVYLLFAAIGIADVIRRFPADRRLAMAGIVLLAGWELFTYYTKLDRSDAARYFASAAATPMGRRAAELAAGGERVICVVSKDASAIRYLTWAHAADVRIAEFYFRPPVAAEIPLAQFRPAVVLVERADAFTPFIRELPGQHTPSVRFEEIRLVAR